MSYTIEFRGRTIINKRGNKDCLRYRRPNLPPIQFNLCRALDEKGNVFRRTIDTSNIDEYKPK